MTVQLGTAGVDVRVAIPVAIKPPMIPPRPRAEYHRVCLLGVSFLVYLPIQHTKLTCDQEHLPEPSHQVETRSDYRLHHPKRDPDRQGGFEVEGLGGKEDDEAPKEAADAENPTSWEATEEISHRKLCNEVADVEAATEPRVVGALEA